MVQSLKQIAFLLSLGIDLDKIIENSNTLDKLDALEKCIKTDDKRKIQVILNTLTNMKQTKSLKKTGVMIIYSTCIFARTIIISRIDDEKSKLVPDRK